MLDPKLFAALAWPGIVRLCLDDRSAPLRLDEGEPIAAPGPEPKWQKLFPMGATKFRADFGKEGKLTFTREWCQTLVDNAKALVAKGHRIQVNYHHLGGDVDPSTPLENTVAAGWMQDVELRADGPYALIGWTERARKFIEAQELGYLSPEFFLDYTSRDTGKPQGPTLVGAALTNVPFLKELPRVAASDTPQPPAPAEGESMDPKKLRKLLKLSENATDAEVEAALLALGGSAEKLSLTEREGAVKLKEMQGVVVTLTEKVNALEADKAKMLAEQRGAAVKGFLDELVKVGKVTPAMRPSLEAIALDKGVEAIKFMEQVKPTVSMTETGVPAGDPASTSSTADATAKYFALVDAEIAKGVKYDVAARTVNKAHPELQKAASKIEPPPERA
jgi:phage I-like protein